MHAHVTVQEAMVQGLANRLKHYPTAQIVAGSALFDADWYLATNPDVRRQGRAFAFSHYLEHGARERRDPGPLFDTAYYLSQFPQLDPGRVNPVCHYLIYGEAAGAWPNRFFDPLHVAAQLETVRPGENVLASYVALGPTRIAPSSAFNANAYMAANPPLAASGLNPLWHRLFHERSIDPLDALVGDGYACTARNHLSALTVKNGLVHFHVTGDDPHLVLARGDAGLIPPGHYRLSFRFAGPKSVLERAKAYFDTGSGFSEANCINLDFRERKQGWLEADLALDEPLLGLRIDPTDGHGGDAVFLAIGQVQLAPLRRSDYYLSLLAQIAPAPAERFLLACQFGLGAVFSPAKTSRQLRDLRLKQNASKSPQARAQASYKQWIEKFDTISAEDRQAMAEMMGTFSTRPTISVVMPVYNTPEKLLRECIDSVLDQTYPDWELCIADDRSTAPHVRAVLESYAAADRRIKVVFRPENGHISKASNSAIEIATGDWIALLDHDDLLAPHALFCIAEAINRHPDAKLIYSDEDKIDLDGQRSDPYFKSDWNERLFFEQNMVSHLGAMRKDLCLKVGGFRAGFEGSQDHDLVLRVTEGISPADIIHVPHVLYHWRILPGSTALAAGEKSYAIVAGAKSLEEALARRGIDGSIDTNLSIGYYRLKLKVPTPQPHVSIIIPTRDGVDLLAPCIASLIEKTDYKSYEILIVDNQSQLPETFEYFRTITEDQRIRILKYDDVFNYSAINNFAVREAKGPLLCLLNNDTEVISGNWLSEMVAELSQDRVGAVGAKLLYSDGTVQHAGVLIGFGGERGVAGHALLGIPGSAPGYFAHALLAREVSAVTAACLLTSRDAFEAVEGLNEKELRVAFNDVDFCLKLREAGYKIIWTPHAVLHHHESKSRGSENTPEKQARFQGEVDYMLGRWGDGLYRDGYYNPNLSVDDASYTLSRAPRAPKPWNALRTPEDAGH